MIFCRASVSHRFNKSGGNRFMFIALVLVGQYDKGNSSLSRPPHDSMTNLLFDTTVDSISQPTIFVKYDMQEYYPEYIVEYF